MKCIYLKQKLNRELYCNYNKKRLERGMCASCNADDRYHYSPAKFKTHKKHKQTKFTDIPKKVKLIVWERDNHKCLFCGKQVPWNNANSHYIKRSHGGLGIEENIMTNCEKCHAMFEESPYRSEMKAYAKRYFKSMYPNWDEKELIYKKSKKVVDNVRCL